MPRWGFVRGGDDRRACRVPRPCRFGHVLWSGWSFSLQSLPVSPVSVAGSLMRRHVPPSRAPGHCGAGRSCSGVAGSDRAAPGAVRSSRRWRSVFSEVGPAMPCGPARGHRRAIPRCGRNRPSGRRDRAIGNLGRALKPEFLLQYMSEPQLRANRQEFRHRLARRVCHGRRGELTTGYREGQEEKLGALGLMLNVIALWNALCQ